MFCVFACLSWEDDVTFFSCDFSGYKEASSIEAWRHHLGVEANIGSFSKNVTGLEESFNNLSKSSAILVVSRNGFGDHFEAAGIYEPCKLQEP